MNTPPKPDSKKPSPPEMPEDKTPETGDDEAEAPKPDSACYGDWTVNGIAVDF